ncbi:MAG: metal-sensitive transcriptional regulator [Elusimicrobiota bacterium]
MEQKHSGQVRRLNRIEGQVRGIRKMIEDGRYCVDIATQIKAVRAALKQVELSVFDSHMRTCVKSAFESKNKKRIEAKLGEIQKLLRARDG